MSAHTLDTQPAATQQLQAPPTTLAPSQPQPQQQQQPPTPQVCFSAIFTLFDCVCDNKFHICIKL